MAVCLMALALVVSPSIPRVSAATGTAPSMTLSESTGLRDGQLVTATVAGLVSQGYVSVAECGPGMDFNNCDEVSTFVAPDANGAASVQVLIAAVLSLGGTPLDCRAQPAGSPCRLVLLSYGSGGRSVTGPSVAATVALAFDPSAPLAPPQLSVTPSADLSNGQLVHVHGSGFAPGRSVSSGICLQEANPTSCAFLRSRHDVVTTAGGDIDTDVAVPSVVFTATAVRIDCRVQACQLIVGGPRAGYPMVAAGLAFSPTTGAPPEATLTTSADTGLIDRQVIAVHASGFAARSYITIEQCGSSCRWLGGASADANGVLDVSGAVMAAFSGSATETGPGGLVDCRTETCRLVLSSNGTESRVGTARLTFDPAAPLAPAPVIAVHPSTGLRDGQAVTVTGTGFPVGRWTVPGQADAGQSVSIRMCRSVPVTSCTQTTQWPTVDANGQIAITYRLRAVIDAGGQFDCRTAVQPCRVVVGDIQDPFTSAAADVRFDPAAPLLEPAKVVVTPGPYVDGQVVHVRTTGVPPGGVITVQQCRGDRATFDACEQTYIVRQPSAPDDTFDTDVIVDATMHVDAGGTGPGQAGAAGGTDVDCSVADSACHLIVTITDPGSVDQVTAAALTVTAVPGGTRLRDRVFSDVDVTSGIVYGRAVGQAGTMEELKLDLYEPRGDTAAVRPVVVYAHSGYFISGDRSEGEPLALDLARRGYVVISIDYRLYPQGGLVDPDRLKPAFVAAQHDMQAAVRWARAHAAEHRLSPTAIGATGYSAGAVTAVRLAFWAADPGDSGNPGYPSDVAAVVSLAGSALDADNGFAVVVHPGAPPMLMIHGDQDTTVPYMAAQATCADSKALGNDCTLITYPGAGHDFTPRYGDFLPRMVGFFAERLGPLVSPTVSPATVPPTNPPVGPGMPSVDVRGVSVARPVVATPTFTG